jgi:hypothetical protein
VLRTVVIPKDELNMGARGKAVTGLEQRAGISALVLVQQTVNWQGQGIPAILSQTASVPTCLGH